MAEYWCKKHRMSEIMIARIKRLDDKRPVFRTKIKEIFYKKGFALSTEGENIGLIESDLKKPKEVMRFVFEEI